jgi:hypothetical protein
MPGETGVTVVTMLVCFLSFAYEAAGASRARHSLRPLDFGGKENFRQTSGVSRRENVKSCLGIVDDANSIVMPGLDPGIHRSSQEALCKEDGSPGQAR